ncbi:hypothetical protein ACFLU6_05390 [Acidobacteriota bacterium]
MEDALLTALSDASFGKSSGPMEDTLIRTIVESLCKKPLSEDKVIPALVRLIDESQFNYRVISTAIGESKPLSRSKAQGTALLARYWHVLSTTQNERLILAVSYAMNEDDDRILTFLRKARDIDNPRARGYAAAALVSNHGFDLQREARLIKKLLKDRSRWVRISVIRSLAARYKGIDPEYQIKVLLKIFAKHSAFEERVRALRGVFDVLARMPRDARAKYLADRHVGLPKRMIEYLDDQSFRPTIVSGTRRIASLGWHGTEGNTEVEKTKEWWASWRSYVPQR